MRDTIYIPPKVRHNYKGMMYYTDFERHVGRALPKAHRAVISRLESLRFHGKAVRAVITEAPDGRSTRSYHTPLHDLLLEYARWLIDTVFRDPELDEDPMICCIGRQGHHTRSMIRRGLGYKVMNANVVNWSRRAIAGTMYNPESLRGYTFDHAPEPVQLIFIKCRAVNR